MRYKLTIEYDGTGLLGWQEQQDGPSVQDYLQKSLSCFTPAPADECPQVPNAALDDNDFSEAHDGASTERRPAAYIDVHEEASTGKRLQVPNKIIVYGAGRTDAGVHALAQTANFHLEPGYDAADIMSCLKKI